MHQISQRLRRFQLSLCLLLSWFSFSCLYANNIPPFSSFSQMEVVNKQETHSWREDRPNSNGQAVFKDNDSQSPIALYLTWQHSPLTTMTIQWITTLESLQDAILYQRRGDTSWKEAAGAHVPFPDNYPGLIHRVELTDLTPGTEYNFRIGTSTENYKFKTMPADLQTPIRFVVGGDIYHDSIEHVKETNLAAAKLSPDFALLGGDLAYTTEKETLPENADRWITWLIAWSKTMVALDGRLIPMITTIGNHDTQGRYGQTTAQAPYYYALFPTPGNLCYRTVDFANYLSLFILDTGHTHPIAGAQTVWLEEALNLRKNSTHRFALYHVGAYPSVRQMESKMSPVIREHWVPLFERNQLHACFEHHDHAYKRTVRIRNNQADPSGVLYIGDGAWGVAEPRLPKNLEGQWFLAKTAAERHFILVTIEKTNRSFKAINSKSDQFDEYEIKD